MQIISGIPDAARVGLLKLIRLQADDIPTTYTQIVTTVNSKQDFETIVEITDFPYANVTNEGSLVTFDELIQGHKKSFRPQMRTLATKVSDQASYTDLYDAVAKPAKPLAEALAKTKELAVANILNLGFSSTTNTIDSVVLFSTAHSLPTGGTAANRPATDIALTAIGLEQGFYEMRRQVSGRGTPMPFRGNAKLVVAPENQFNAQRILTSVGLAGTADNDPNVVGTRCQLVVDDFLTAANAWFLLGDGHNLGLIERIPLFVKTSYDIDTLSTKVVSGEEYIAFSGGWRRTWGTNP